MPAESRKLTKGTAVRLKIESKCKPCIEFRHNLAA